MNSSMQSLRHSNFSGKKQWSFLSQQRSLETLIVLSKTPRKSYKAYSRVFVEFSVLDNLLSDCLGSISRKSRKI